MILERLSQLRLGKRFIISVPFVWLLIFFVVPFLILVRISVTDMGNGVDPFAPLMETVDGVLRIMLKYQNYLSIFEEVDDSGAVLFGQTIYIEAFLTSVKYAFWTTVLCLVIGYPFAYAIARARKSFQPALLMMIMLPFWTSFLLRVYAWKGILADQGVLNETLNGFRTR